MKKVVVGIFTLVLLLISIGCSQNNLENYKEAVIKTDSITKGTENMEININVDYNKEGLDDETIRIINSFENVKFTLKNSFDNEINKFMGIGYFNFGNLGYDFKLYGVDEKNYIEPLFLNIKDKKYIEISEEELSPQKEIPKDIFEEIVAKWNEIINEENVTKGENVLVSTEDGEVKSKEFTIDLKGEQLKEFLLYLVEVFEENDEYKKMFEEVTYIKEEENLTQKEKDELYLEMFETLKSLVEETENLKLFYKAYIDIDGYIVQEDVRFSFENESNKIDNLNSFQFEMTNKLSNIEKEQELNFISPRLEETISIEEIDFESLMNPQEEVK